MAHLLVKKPITSNGVNLVMNGGQIQYRESIVQLPAKKDLEKINSKLPDHLKMIIEVVEDEPKAKIK